MLRPKRNFRIPIHFIRKFPLLFIRRKRPTFCLPRRHALQRRFAVLPFSSLLPSQRPLRLPSSSSRHPQPPFLNEPSASASLRPVVQPRAFVFDLASPPPYAPMRSVTARSAHAPQPAHAEISSGAKPPIVLRASERPKSPANEPATPSSHLPSGPSSHRAPPAPASSPKLCPSWAPANPRPLAAPSKAQ
jgi:hypothetical protein